MSANASVQHIAAGIGASLTTPATYVAESRVAVGSTSLDARVAQLDEQAGLARELVTQLESLQQQVEETLRVQLRGAHGWITFPLPTITDWMGRFTAYVELVAPEIGLQVAPLLLQRCHRNA